MRRTPSTPRSWHSLSARHKRYACGLLRSWFGHLDPELPLQPQKPGQRGIFLSHGTSVRLGIAFRLASNGCSRQPETVTLFQFVKTRVRSALDYVRSPEPILCESPNWPLRDGISTSSPTWETLCSAPLRVQLLRPPAASQHCARHTLFLLRAKGHRRHLTSKWRRFWQPLPAHVVHFIAAAYT